MKQVNWIKCVVLIGVFGGLCSVFLPAEDLSVTQKSEMTARVLDLALHQLKQCGNLDAKFHFVASVFGQRIHGQGFYQEEKNQYPHCSLRYEITFQLPDGPEGKTSRTILLLDKTNQSLWFTQNPYDLHLFSNQSERDIFSYHINLKKVQDSPKIRTPAGAFYGPPWYGQKSLENVLIEIRDSFQFDELFETTISSLQVSQNEPIPVYYLRGVWKPDLLEKRLVGRKPHSGERQMISASGRYLPEEIPSEVRLYFDKTRFFPLQIEYLRRNRQGEVEPMLRVIFYDIHYNVRFLPNQFEFWPASFSDMKDLTDEFLQHIPTETSKP